MRPGPRCALLSLCLVGAAGCHEPTPCDEWPGTCLDVYLSTQGGEAVDRVELAVDGPAGVVHRQERAVGEERLPLLLGLPLPDTVEGQVTVRAIAHLMGMRVASGERVVAGLVLGAHRVITVQMLPEGAIRPRCENGRKDGGELGVDCGGLCPPCVPSCADGMKNGAETDADCGGPCVRCLSGRLCTGPADCASARCEGGLCARALGISGLSPQNGPAAGGAGITLLGEFFEPAMQVRFGAAPAAVQSVAPDGRSAVVLLPPGAAGRADILVSAGGMDQTRPAAFGYYFTTLRFSPTPPAYYPTGSKPYFVVAGQLNKNVDGHLDLLLINELDGDLSLYLGNGDGTFADPSRIPSPATLPLMVRLGDFNGDGVPDFATADHRKPTASVHLGNGDGTFLAPLSRMLPLREGKAQPVAIAIADYNRDGRDDYAVVDEESRGALYVLLAQPDGSLGEAGPLGGHLLDADNPVPTVAAGRFDADDAIDLVVTTTSPERARIYLNNGDGTFRAGAVLSPGTAGPHTVAVIDLDRDGDQDLVLAGRNGHSVALLLGQGDGTFARARVTPAGETPYTVEAGDLDGDGVPDVAVPNWRAVLMGQGAGTLLLSDGQGGLPRSLTLPVPLGPYGLALGDFNGDGKLDLAATGIDVNKLGVFLNTSR